MKIFKTKLRETKYKNLIDFAPTNDHNAIYIDIETTGFSRKNDVIYLIGLIYYEKHELVVEQYLCEKDADEYELLYKFNQLIKNYDEVIHFNGDSFDLPFIKERMKLYRIKENLSSLRSLDFLKELRPLKKVLGTDNLKLKTMEKLAGYHRIDPFSGGELIQLYHSYINGDTDLESTFVLHNEEDMVGLYYLNVFRPLISLKEINLSNETYNLSLEKSNLMCYLNISIQLPLNYYEINLKRDDFTIILDSKGLTLQLPILIGEYKTFFEDYKNYYYLIKEDYSIHESMASFVQSKYKKKATKHTAYTKHDGQYIKCPIKHSHMLAITNEFDNVYIFNETINDSFVLLRIEDLNLLLPNIISTLISNLLF